jgi:hypothetical protein
LAAAYHIDFVRPIRAAGAGTQKHGHQLIFGKQELLRL